MNSEIRRLGLDASYAAAGNEDLVQNALCPICHDYIEDARETDCAARHVFCGPCIKDVSDRNQPCPCCRGQFSKTERPQGLMRSFIEQVKWKCLNFENGCAFTGTKKQLEKHLDDDCAVQEFKCPFSGCQEKMRRGALDAHKNTCPYRLLPCFFCQAQVRFNCMTAHRDRCPKFPIPCPKMCGQNVPRWQVSQHFERECAEQVLDCRVSGCGERVKRKLMDQHEDDNMKRHLKLVYTELAKQEQQRKSLQTEIAQLKSHWHFAQLHSPSLTDDCLELTVRLPDFETKSAGMVRGEGQFLHSVRFLFQDRPFCLRIYPKGDSGAPEGKVSVFLVRKATYNGRLTFTPVLSNGNVRRELTYEFSNTSESTRGWLNFCSQEDLLSAVRATQGGALEFCVRLSAPKSNRSPGVVSGYE